jgi:hypothetical protein
MLSLSGCGSVAPGSTAGLTDKKGETVSQMVMSRAQLRWDSLLKSDMDSAYRFISPAGRSTMPVEKYRPRVNAAFWRGAKVKEALCEAETCDVTVMVELTVEGIKTSVPVKETWILEAGQWWFVYQG